MVLVMSTNHVLAEKSLTNLVNLQQKILFTYPVPREMLDIFNYFLNPANVQPERHKSLESTEIILQMVAAGREVTALPRWLMEQYTTSWQLETKSLGKKGIFKKNRSRN